MDPGILDELLHSGGGFDHHVGPEPPHLESSLRIELAKAIYRGCRKNVNCREVEEGLWRHKLLCNLLSVGKTLYVRPILLITRLFQ